MILINGTSSANWDNKYYERNNSKYKSICNNNITSSFEETLKSAIESYDAVASSPHNQSITEESPLIALDVESIDKTMYN